MATRYAITDGRDYWKRKYDHDNGHWAGLDKATTYGSSKAAAASMEERRNYLSAVGKRIRAAALRVVPVEA